MKKTYLISIIVLLLSCSAFSQQDSITTLEDYLEIISDESIIDQEDSQILDLLELLLLYPVNINEANLQDILIIPFIDANSAQRIIEYRNINGNFFSKNELYSIDGLSEQLITILKPVISVTNENPKEIFVPDPDAVKTSSSRSAKPTSSYRVALRSRVITDLQNRRGFTNNAYEGSKLKSYFRIRGDYKRNYSFSALVEKDAGENSFTDFYSVNFSANNILFFDRIIIGDYLSEFGQGIVLWSPYAFSKGSDATSTVIRKARKLSQYTSSDENQFFRGVALRSEFFGVGITGFFSVNEVDATIVNMNEVSSISLSGLHRTTSEINKKDNLRNNSIGMMIDANILPNFNISFLQLNSRFNKKFVPSQKFGLTGDSFNYSSLAYDFIYKKIRVAGETAYNSISVATINSFAFELTKDFSAVVLIRSYPRNFSNLYGNGFGESSRTQNEFGIYTGFKWRTNYGNFNVYYDQFKFPFVTNDLALPSTGNEIMINYSERISRGFYFSARYKNELKEIDEVIDNVQQLVDRRLQKIRTDFIYNINKNLRLRSRIEYSNYTVKNINDVEEGFLFFQDIRLNLSQDLRLYARLILFQTDSFNSRLYEFENDLTGVLSNPALFGEGIKWYVLFNYNLLDYLKISFKYSELYKPNEENLSSGQNLITDNIDNRISFQIDYRL